MTSALAIFVKTPGLSPIKTRLAGDLGEAFARDFYEHSVVAMTDVGVDLMKKTPGLNVYWAVAEEDGLADPRWQAFPTIWQGPGNLGQRLHKVYSSLQSQCQTVFLMGADSPHISSNNILQNLHETLRLSKKQFTMGRSADGGFYFFGGAQEIPQSVWEKVTYSQPTTADQLVSSLEPIGYTRSLIQDIDIDRGLDLAPFLNLDFDTTELLTSQIRLIQWVRRTLEGQNGKV